MASKVLITGGAGFIGTNLIKRLIDKTNYTIINLDKLTYCSNRFLHQKLLNNSRYQFYQIDICDYQLLDTIFRQEKPDFVMHLAAESHVDRSILNPNHFIQTNIIGTYNLLQISLNYWNGLSAEKQSQFRFHHISTDEVYGDLEPNAPAFTENNSYAPSSPYSASKASSDHLVRAWYRTYGLPILITNCSNNYGPFQYPEKLIPLCITNALAHKPLPVYGDGHQIRDWLFVEDHVRALQLVLEKGQIGETYNIGGNNEIKNLDIIKNICNYLDTIYPSSKFVSYQELINFVPDRLGHDKRYAINNTKIKEKLEWEPQFSFQEGLQNTIKWYLEENQSVQAKYAIN